MMKTELARQIAEAMECGPELLPYLAELVADLEELGGTRRVVLELLRPLNLPTPPAAGQASARVLDLGCGKGAVLLALAEEFGFEGVGVDAFPPFIEAAQQAAAERGLADKCRFRQADLREVAGEYRDFDVAMMLALGAAIGSPAEIVALLRGCVRTGGYMVIEDSFLAAVSDDQAVGTETSERIGGHGSAALTTSRPPLQAPGYESYSDHETVFRQLGSHGDKILHEHIRNPEDVVRECRAQLEGFRRRAEKIAREHPEAAPLLAAYLDRQEREGELAARSVLNATWLLQQV